MTKKVLEFKLRTERYRITGGGALCVKETKKYFGVGDVFDLCFSVKPPRHDEYYILVADRSTWMWVFFNGPEAKESPWPRWLDTWLTKNFGRKGKVYMWAMG